MTFTISKKAQLGLKVNQAFFIWTESLSDVGRYCTMIKFLLLH